MIVFQLTLKGWKATRTTPETEACIKWVKAPNRKVLNKWLEDNGIADLVVDVDTNPQGDYGFEDGVDVMLSAKGTARLPKDVENLPSLIEEWKDEVKAALESVRRKKRKFGPPTVTEQHDGPRVIVYVAGGNVQQIKSDNPDVRIAVLDEDNREDMEEDSIDAEEWDDLEREYDNLPHAIY